MKTHFQVSAGLAGKDLKRYLSGEMWTLLESTYCDAQSGRIWQALFEMGELFRITAQLVAHGFNFEYIERDDEQVSAFIRMIANLTTEK